VIVVIESSDAAFAPPASWKRFGFAGCLEWGVAAAAVAVAIAAVYMDYFAPSEEHARLTKFAELQTLAHQLAAESDPIKREQLRSAGSEVFRSLDSSNPTNSRVFLAGVLGPENTGRLGFLYFMTYYLFPREVAVSLGEPAKYTLQGMTGHNPQSAEEVGKAGYDLLLDLTIPPEHGVADSNLLEYEMYALHPLPARPSETLPLPLTRKDSVIALLLPLAVALAGRRLACWLFRELDGVLSQGEWLACGLALGAFFSTQGILALRLAGARLEGALAVIVMVWGVVELALLILRLRKQPPRFQVRQLWWLLLAPAALMLWPLFRLAGLEGLTDFDGVAMWAFKAKLFHALAGKELWPWFHNPALAYAHLDYPLLVPLLHAFTYGALGHVNEFVTKYWNQWMLVLLAWAVLEAGQFPRTKPWLAAAAVTAPILFPSTLDFSRMEGATIPMTFFAVTSSLQLALGLAEGQPGRLRLGLLLLMATAMVKFEGMLLLALWVMLLALDRDARCAFWPLRRMVRVGLLGLAGWIPYVVFRLHGPVPHPESTWLSLLVGNAGNVLQIAPMTCLSILARRFVNNDFAVWGAADNHHAVWQGHWTGVASLFDEATLGVAWVCVLIVVAAWSRGGKLRWTALKLCLVFLVFACVISIVWSSTHSAPLDYAGALDGSTDSTGGRYLYPVLLSWFAVSVVLLTRSGAYPCRPQ
jgi:hypothetical protein